MKNQQTKTIKNILKLILVILFISCSDIQENKIEELNLNSSNNSNSVEFRWDKAVQRVTDPYYGDMDMAVTGLSSSDSVTADFIDYNNNNQLHTTKFNWYPSTNEFIYAKSVTLLFVVDKTLERGKELSVSYDIKVNGISTFTGFFNKSDSNFQQYRERFSSPGNWTSSIPKIVSLQQSGSNITVNFKILKPLKNQIYKIYENGIFLNQFTVNENVDYLKEYQSTYTYNPSSLYGPKNISIDVISSLSIIGNKTESDAKALFNPSISGPGFISYTQNCTYTVNVAGGASPYSYKFYKNGTLIYSGTSNSVTTKISATSTISCEVTDADGSSRATNMTTTKGSVTD